MSRLTRDGTAEPVSRDQILRHERGQGNIIFPCSADHVQDWQPHRVDSCSCYMCDHTCRRPDSLTCFFISSFPFVSLEMSRYPSIFCTIAALSLYREYVVRYFFPNGVLQTFDHGLDFLHQLMREFNQSINQSSSSNGCCLFSQVLSQWTDFYAPLFFHTHCTCACMYVCMYVWSSHIAEYESTG